MRRSKGHGSWLLRCGVGLVFTALPIACIEILLRLAIIPLPEVATQYVFGCYEPTQPRRYIHTVVTPLALSLHRPGFSGTCFFQGYWWHHQSDAFGWRNPETWDAADAVVLGDSMVYGHGVEESQTATHFMREISGRHVVNLGITGGSPVHHLANLRNFGLPLHPAVAIVLFFGNDLGDIRATRSPEQVQRFVETGDGAETQVMPREQLLGRLRLPGKQEPDVLDVFAVYRLLQYALRSRGLMAFQEPARPVDPREAVVATLAASYAREVAYLRRAVAMMAESSRAAGTALVVGNLGLRQPVDVLIERQLQELSREYGLHYFDDTPVLDGRHRLPRDGHLNEAGHRRLAEALVAFIDERRLW